MSSGRNPPPLQGVIWQGDRVVGGFELSAPPERFIRQFNRQYGRLGLRAARAEQPVRDDSPRRPERNRRGDS